MQLFAARFSLNFQAIPVGDQEEKLMAETAPEMVQLKLKRRKTRPTPPRLAKKLNLISAERANRRGSRATLIGGSTTLRMARFLNFYLFK